ncbi:MAG: [protein-PII] uridylyltransferase [Gammaproteobacteria bacterium]|nr:[protein-PII] uridylyltransferase [Gammaproteobacteria bacterium]
MPGCPPSLWDIAQDLHPNNEASSPTFFRKALQQGQYYLQQQFDLNVDIVDLLHFRSHFVDQVLKALWQQHVGQDDKISLLAVGGYGRGELHPYSDIDLLILLDHSVSEQPPSGLTDFLTQLWDIGLDIGHSVRTIEQCRQQSAQDITIATNLLETRLLSGDNSLYNALHKLTTDHKTWDTRLFYQAKRQEQLQRHQKYNDTANNLEPNIKESPGGLRDIHIINWVAQQHFNVNNLQGLNDKGFISNSEYDVLDKAQRFLWRVRFVLHSLAKRKQEKLMINYQRDIATQLGYVDCDNRLAVEHFMKDYYLCARSIGQMNELLLQLFEEKIILADKPSHISPINRRFQVHNGYLETINHGIFAYYPYAMLELFLILQQHPEIKGVRADTIRQIHAHLHLIDQRFRNDIKNQALFMEIIRQPKGITHEFRRMNTLGVLGAYLPEFGQIVGQMQHDLFHAYTVDEHTLFLVRNLRRFSYPEFQDEFPLCSDIFKQLPKHELLYIAGLFHDIAKGRGGDHSILGVADATAFCQRHSLSSFDTDIVTFLVRNHLSMSLVAQKSDIHDPDVIKLFVKTVQTINRLNYLYLLTVADIRATNNNLWNGWRDSLLKQLYQNTKQWLEQSEQLAKNSQEKAAKSRQQALTVLVNSSWSKDQIEALWHPYDYHYFSRHTVEDIVWQTQYRLQNPDKKTLLTSRPLSHNTLELFFFTQDRPRIFAAVTACLGRLDLDVLDAKINATHDGNTLNTYIVNGSTDNPTEIIMTLSHSLENLDKISTTFSGITPRTMTLFETKPTINFRSNTQQSHTVMELNTHDRPGLLSSIAQVFLQCDIQVVNAKLTTLGDQVEDVFFITSSQNEPLSDAQQDHLKQALISGLTAS